MPWYGTDRDTKIVAVRAIIAAPHHPGPPCVRVSVAVLTERQEEMVGACALAGGDLTIVKHLCCAPLMMS